MKISIERGCTVWVTEPELAILNNLKKSKVNFFLESAISSEYLKHIIKKMLNKTLLVRYKTEQGEVRYEIRSNIVW